jgi:chromosome partitioning protein
VPHTIPHREHMREAALLEVPVWRLAKDTRRSAPIVREVVSYIVDQAEREAA